MVEKKSLRERLATMSKEELLAALRATAEGDKVLKAKGFLNFEDDRAEVDEIMAERLPSYLEAAGCSDELSSKEESMNEAAKEKPPYPESGDEGYEEYVELCRQDAERCLKVWQGHREVVSDAWRKIFKGEGDNEEEKKDEPK